MYVVLIPAADLANGSSRSLRPFPPVVLEFAFRIRAFFAAEGALDVDGVDEAEVDASLDDDDGDAVVPATVLLLLLLFLDAGLAGDDPSLPLPPPLLLLLLGGGLERDESPKDWERILLDDELA